MDAFVVQRSLALCRVHAMHGFGKHMPMQCVGVMLMLKRQPSALAECTVGFSCMAQAKRDLKQRSCLVFEAEAAGSPAHAERLVRGAMTLSGHEGGHGAPSSVATALTSETSALAVGIICPAMLI